MRVLLLSTYELGHQPLALARPAAGLLAAGHQVVCNDLAVEPLDEAALRAAEFVGISVPMHTATRLGMRLAERIKAINPAAHRCFFGLYASLHADVLLGRLAESAVGGEFETPLLELVGRLQGGANPALAPSGGVLTLDGGGVFLGRQPFDLPARQLLPPLERYARLDDGQRQKLVGYVEASRGCAHRCLHCPITPVYGGRLRIVPEDLVLADIRQLVALGAEHITFGDPDFFNGIKHSLRIVESLHAEFPAVSYDVTIKVEHLLEHRARLPLLAKTGCAFILSAVEAIDDGVLEHLAKGHTAADVSIALGLVEAAGLVLRPTFVAFTPWISLEGYLDLLEFVERRGLIPNVDAVQFAIRLLVPRGSSLLGTPGLEPYLGPFDHETLTHTWRHPDPRVDALQLRVADLAERAARLGQDGATTFYQIKALATGVLDRPVESAPPLAVGAGRPVPRLTEAWFC